MGKVGRRPLVLLLAGLALAVTPVACSLNPDSPQSEGAKVDDGTVHQAVRSAGAWGDRTPWIMAATMGTYGELTRANGISDHSTTFTVELRLVATQQADELDGGGQVLTTRCYRVRWDLGPSASMADFDGTTESISCRPGPAASPTTTAPSSTDTHLRDTVQYLAVVAGGGDANPATLRAQLATALPGATIELAVEPSPHQYDHPPPPVLGIAVRSGTTCVYANAVVTPATPTAASEVHAWVAVPADEGPQRFGCHALDAAINAAQSKPPLVGITPFENRPYQGP